MINFKVDLIREKFSLTVVIQSILLFHCAKSTLSINFTVSENIFRYPGTKRSMCSSKTNYQRLQKTFRSITDPSSTPASMFPHACPCPCASFVVIQCIIQIHLNTAVNRKSQYTVTTICIF